MNALTKDWKEQTWGYSASGERRKLGWAYGRQGAGPSAFTAGYLPSLNALALLHAQTQNASKWAHESR